MNHIVRYTKALEAITIFGAVTLIIMKGIQWLGGMSMHPLHIGLKYAESDVPGHYAVVDQIATMPFSHRLIGLCVDAFMMIIVINGLLCFIRLMRTFRAGEFFSESVMQQIKKLSVIAFVWAVCNPISYMLLSVITTWHNKPRTLALAVGTADLINCIIFGGFVLIASMVQEGHRLQQERDLTI